MARYAARAIVWLQIDSDYPDGVGEAQREVEYLVNRINIGAAEGVGRHVEITRALDIEIMDPKLREEPGESCNKLFFGDVILDNGMR